MEISAKPSLLHERCNQRAHQGHECHSHPGIARHIRERVKWHLDQSEQHDQYPASATTDRTPATNAHRYVRPDLLLARRQRRRASEVPRGHPSRRGSSTSATAEAPSPERTKVLQGCSEDW